VSFFLSITFIPMLLKVMYKNGTAKKKWELWFDRLYNNTIGRLVEPYVSVIKYSNTGHRVLRRSLLTVGVIVLLIVSVKSIMPTIGKDAMPPMDTGIVKAQIAFSSNETVNSAEKKIVPFLEWLQKQSWANKSSVAFGTEAGVLSLGSGNLPAEATITIHEPRQRAALFAASAYGPRLPANETRKTGAAPDTPPGAPLGTPLETPPGAVAPLGGWFSGTMLTAYGKYQNSANLTGQERPVAIDMMR